MRKMKESAEWTESLPETWNETKIHQLYRMRSKKVSDTEYPPLSVTMQGIVPQLDSAAKTDAHDDRKLVKAGDFVINSRSDRRGSCGISSLDGSVSLINTVMEPREKMNPEYYNWLFHTDRFADEFYRRGHGIVDDLWTTKWSDMKRIDVPHPPIEEQAKIANFLNNRCSKIDEAISRNKQIIEKLEEYRKAVITQAVTKGLDPNVEMKDSGVKWIGETSVYCNPYKLKFGTYMKGRIGWQGLKSNDFIDKGPYCITSTDFVDGKVNWNTCYHVSEERYDMDPFIQIKVGDLLISKDGTIGKLAIIDELPDKACLNSHLLILRPTDDTYITKYLFYVLKSNVFNKYYESVSTGSTMQSLSQEKLSNFVIPLWNCDEQHRIVEYLDKKCSQIDESIQKQKDIVAKLEEYKKSLIYNAVTGKIEV